MYINSICNFQGNKELNRLKFGLPHYDLHHAIFGSVVATGRFAAPSTDPYLRRGVEDDDADDGSDDTEAFTMATGPRSGDKRAGSSRGGG